MLDTVGSATGVATGSTAAISSVLSGLKLDSITGGAQFLSILGTLLSLVTSNNLTAILNLITAIINLLAQLLQVVGILLTVIGPLLGIVNLLPNLSQVLPQLLEIIQTLPAFVLLLVQQVLVALITVVSLLIPLLNIVLSLSCSVDVLIAAVLSVLDLEGILGCLTTSGAILQTALTAVQSILSGILVIM